MRIGFRAPYSDRSPIHPATALQLSIRNQSMEIFMDRLVPRDIDEAEPGGVDGDGDDDNNSGRLCVVRTPLADIPRVKYNPTHVEFDVVMHAWRGEKYLGSWVVGTIPWEVLGVE